MRAPAAAEERVRLAREIVAAYLQARRELRRAPIESVVAALRSEEASQPPRTPGPHTLEEARRLGWVVARTLKLMPGDTRCLARSLVLTRLLARRGIPAKLVIGAQADSGVLRPRLGRVRRPARPLARRRVVRTARRAVTGCSQEHSRELLLLGFAVLRGVRTTTLRILDSRLPRDDACFWIWGECTCLRGRSSVQ